MAEVTRAEATAQVRRTISAYRDRVHEVRNDTNRLPPEGARIVNEYCSFGNDWQELVQDAIRETSFLDMMDDGLLLEYCAVCMELDEVLELGSWRIGRVDRIEIAHEGLEVDNDSADNFPFHVGRNMNGTQAFVSEIGNNLTETFVPVLNGSRGQFVSNMENLVGENYVWGGNSPEEGGMDCSGSIVYGLNQMGNNILNQTASDFYNNYTIAVEGEVQPGDLRFLRDLNNTIIHVQTIVNTNGDRINASGGPENTIENSGIIELLEGPLPASGEIRRLRFGE